MLIVSREVPEPATDAGTNAQLAPLGKPEHANATVPLNPAIAVTVTVEVAGLPGLTVAGESAAAEIWKLGPAGEDPPPQAFSPANNKPMVQSNSPQGNIVPGCPDIFRIAVFLMIWPGCCYKPWFPQFHSEEYLGRIFGGFELYRTAHVACWVINQVQISIL